jgi:hypothetical protein
MITLNSKEEFADQFISNPLENGFDFMKEKELKFYIS